MYSRSIEFDALTTVRISKRPSRSPMLMERLWGVHHGCPQHRLHKTHKHDHGCCNRASGLAVGIMGIGYKAGESISASIAAGEGGQLYPNVINVLKDQGHINQLAYSLWLNDLDSLTGSVLFGGVDTAKYHGELIALPVQLDSQSDAMT